MSEIKLTRRQFITCAGAAALALPFLEVGKLYAAEQRPNFVFILTDDQRFDAMSCAGHPFVRTPNIDRIANEGARFTNAFVTISLCAPSRGCFLTGRYAHSHGVMNNSTQFNDEVPTFPSVLQKAGYKTAYVGKWHMDGQEGPRPGFDRWVSFKGQGVYDDPVLNIDGKTQKTPGYMTDLLTDFAVDWLKGKRDAPFCLYLAHKAVHGPFKPAARHADLYSDAKITLPDTVNEDMTGRPQWFSQRQEATKETGEAFAERIRNYYRTLAAVDESAGRVLKTLDDMGALDNTVIVFCGDNGFFEGEHGMLDKRAAYEESIRIPFVMRYPKLIKPKTLIDDMALHIDVCPTFLDLAGVQAPKGVQGRSLKPLLNGQTAGWREDFLYEYFRDGKYVTPPMKCVRTKQWKYVEYPEIPGAEELYDLKADPKELKNLAKDPSAAKTLGDMKARLKRLTEETK